MWLNSSLSHKLSQSLVTCWLSAPFDQRQPLWAAITLACKIRVMEVIWEKIEKVCTVTLYSAPHPEGSITWLQSDLSSHRKKKLIPSKAERTLLPTTPLFLVLSDILSYPCKHLLYPQLSSAWWTISSDISYPSQHLQCCLYSSRHSKILHIC